MKFNYDFHKLWLEKFILELLKYIEVWEWHPFIRVYGCIYIHIRGEPVYSFTSFTVDNS